MKATGIVRRIDDLGRVVIPKEIRRTMRIREGDPLEIYTESGGEIVFKKYSPMGELSSFASQYAEILNKTTGTPTVICDREQVIATAGIPKREVLQRRVTQQLEDKMGNRRTYVRKGQEDFVPVEGLDRNGLVCAPIVSGGDLGGAVIFLDSSTDHEANDSHVKLAQSAAMFLAKQMES